VWEIPALFLLMPGWCLPAIALREGGELENFRTKDE
jgi:hypothetical protein